LLLFQILKWEIFEKVVIYKKPMTYSIGLKKLSPLPSFSLSHTLPFLNEIMKNKVFNKIVCSMTKYFSATLMFSIYNKYKEGKIF
jgi:hypothetical protein